MKKLQFLLIIAVLFAVSCQTEKQYKITGEIEGIADNETLYLYNSKTREYFDTVKTMEGKFSFEGTVEEISLFIIIYQNAEGRPTKYKNVWLDNVPVSIKGSFEDFNNVVVDGIKVQEQEKEFERIVEPLRVRLDSIKNHIPDDEENAKILYALYEETMKQEEEMKISFIKNHPDYFFSVFLLEKLIRELEPAEGVAMFDIMPEEMKTSSFGKNVKRYLDLNKDLKVGDKYADLSLKNEKGEEVSLSSVVDGKYALIDFWASWCGPCRRENPTLVKAYEMYKEKGFEIYAVSLDKGEKEWLKAVEEDGITWTTVIDTEAFNSEPAMMYSVRYIPHNFLINDKGEILAIDLRGEDFLAKMDEIFGV